MEPPNRDSPFSSSTSIDNEPSGSAPSSSSSAIPSSSSAQGDGNHQHEPEPVQNQMWHGSASYVSNIGLGFVGCVDAGDEAWSCVVVLLTFCFLASTTLIIGVYGAVTLQLGPNCSRLIQANSFFVDEIRVQELTRGTPRLMLYGFHNLPPLDVKIDWSETHATSLPTRSHQEWMYFLNKGSELNISYNVKSKGSSPLSFVIAQGKESFVEWIRDPLYPNLTLTWKIIHGSGIIQQKITSSSDYYVAMGNLNLEEVEVRLDIRIQALQYNTTDTFYRCSLAHGLCSLKLLFLQSNAAVLASSGPDQGKPDDDLFVKLSYAPRWIVYFISSGALTTLISLIFKICVKFQSTTQVGNRFPTGEVGSERASLLVHKDDDLSCCSSSYGSFSHDEEDPEECLAGGSLETKPVKDGEIDNPRCLCAICFDGPRDSFFLPCGHCVACFTCGTRIAEEAGTCPLCRRKMKKVRKIFTV